MKVWDVKAGRMVKAMPPGKIKVIAFDQIVEALRKDYEISSAAKISHIQCTDLGQLVFRIDQ